MRHPFLTERTKLYNRTCNTYTKQNWDKIREPKQKDIPEQLLNWTVL